MPQLSLYITEELDVKLTEHASKNNRSRSNFIRNLLQEYMDKQQR